MTVTVKVWALVPVQESVDVPEPPTMLVVLSVHVSPAGDTVEDSVAVPVNPLMGLMVIVEVAVAPASMVTLAGDAEIEKSVGAFTVTVTVAEWDSVPLVPVTITVNVLGVLPLQLSVDVPEPVRLVGLSVHVKPAGETVAVSETIPLNPLSAVTEMVEVPLPPWVKLKLVGLAAIAKSCTVTVTVAL